MHVTAITELATSIEAEASALAADLGTTAYEERLKLVAGLPSIVLLSADPVRAHDLLGRLRVRGHGVVCCDSTTVVAGDDMVPLRRFAFDPDALLAPDVPDARLPYADILGIFRASRQTRTETRTAGKSRQFSAGRALLTGGLVMTKGVRREVTNVTEEREQICYLFRASGATPWLLCERGTHYTGLGAAIHPSSAQSFIATIGRLRELAPGALYDERLMNARKVPSHSIRTGVSGSETIAVSSASGVDLLAHLMATWIGSKRRR